MCSKYIDNLDKDSKCRYSQKISSIGGIDPYSLTKKDLLKYASEYPEVTYCDMVNYLVYSKSAYTDKEFKAYKSLQAYKQFVCNWIKDVYSLTIGGLHVVLGKVMHSQSLSEKPLEAWFISQKNGVIESAHCTCMAGLGEACSHVAALMFFVDHNVRNKVSVTSVAAYWMDPGAKSIKFSEVKDIDFSTPQKKMQNLVCPPLSRQLNLMPEVPKLNAEEFSNALKELHESGCNSAILNIVKPYNLKDTDENANEHLFLSKLYREAFMKKSKEELQKLAEQKVFTISKSEAQLIEQETKLQNRESKWFAYRAGRITASNMKAACITQIESPAVSTIKSICYPRKRIINTQSIQWGCRHESTARKTYVMYSLQKHTNFIHENSGLIISPEYPFLGASPDGLISCDCCGEGCLEIKCPYCLKDSSEKDSLLSHSCIIKNDGNVTLSKKHAYYYQVQMQLFLSNRSYCDFVLWNEAELQVVRIEPDLEFWQINSEKLRTFFYKVILPELMGKAYTRPSVSKDKTPNIVFL